MSYFYIRSEKDLYTVGHESMDGKWHGDSDQTTRENAARRVSYLNGGQIPNGYWTEYQEWISENN